MKLYFQSNSFEKRLPITSEFCRFFSFPSYFHSQVLDFHCNIIFELKMWDVSTLGNTFDEGTAE